MNKFHAVVAANYTMTMATVLNAKNLRDADIHTPVGVGLSDIRGAGVLEAGAPVRAVNDAADGRADFFHSGPPVVISRILATASVNMITDQSHLSKLEAKLNANLINTELGY